MEATAGYLIIHQVFLLRRCLFFPHLDDVCTNEGSDPRLPIVAFFLNTDTRGCFSSPSGKQSFPLEKGAQSAFSTVIEQPQWLGSRPCVVSTRRACTRWDTFLCLILRYIGSSRDLKVCSQVRRLLKQLHVGLRQLTVGQLLRRLGDEPRRPLRSQPRLCTRRNWSLTRSSLKRVEDFDKQVPSVTMREYSVVLGAAGWFRGFRQAMERAMAGIAE